MTLQESVGSIRSPKRSSQRYDHNKAYSPRSPRSDSRRDTKFFPLQRDRTTSATSYQDQKWTSRQCPGKKFTKLNTDKATILVVLKTEPDFRPPRPMKPGRLPSSRYCEYHEDTGHTTEQCYQLSNLIESKLRKGHLVHFAETATQTRQENIRDDDRVIDVIFGGHASGGLSNNSRKSYAREIFNINLDITKRPRSNPSPIISFSDEDFPPGIIGGHQDALVITTKVGTDTVKKFLLTIEVQ